MYSFEILYNCIHDAIIDWDEPFDRKYACLDIAMANLRIEPASRWTNW